MSVIPATLELTIYRDRDYSKSFVFKDGDGVVINLSGYAAKAEVRPEKDSTIEIVEFAASIEAVSGRITISLTDAQTLALSTDYVRGWWDLVLTNPSGERHNYIEGAVAIRPTVTRE